MNITQQVRVLIYQTTCWCDNYDDGDGDVLSFTLVHIGLIAISIIFHHQPLLINHQSSLLLICVPTHFPTHRSFTGFPRPRHSNFSWVNFDPSSPFDPTRYYTWLTETTVWQYTFSVPHNVEGMIRAYGGYDMFLNKLDEFFQQEHYNHGNEPDHHVLFLYAYVPGAVWKIQHYLPTIIMKEYGHTGERGLEYLYNRYTLSIGFIITHC